MGDRGYDATKATGMGVILWNPTNEDLPMQYAGRSFTLLSGEKQEVNEKCANHVLNSFGPRGLTFLKYGDEEKTIGLEGIARNKEFKKRQVSLYNQMNEQRKLSRMGYLPATQKVKEYALELGVELIEPYSLKDEEKSAIAKSTVENEVLKAKLENQEKEMAEMKAMMKQFIESQKPPEQKPKGNPNWVKKDG